MKWNKYHFMKSFRIRSFSGPYYPELGQIWESYSVSIGIQPKCGKHEPEKPQIGTLFTWCVYLVT